MKTIAQRKCYLFAPLILVAIVAFSFVTMLLWNTLLPVIFHLPVITFWQALGLLVLSRLLFGGFGHHGRGHHRQWGNPFRDKWETMTAEEREEFLKRRQEHRPSWGCCTSDKKEQGTSDNINA